MTRKNGAGRTGRDFRHRTSCAVRSLRCGATTAHAQSALAQVFYDPATLGHEPPSDHPESPHRLDAIMGRVRILEQQGRVSIVMPRSATDDDVLLVHSSEYLKKVRAEIEAGRRTLSTGDTEL